MHGPQHGLQNCNQFMEIQCGSEMIHIEPPEYRLLVTIHSAGMSQLEGKTWKGSVAELKEKFPPTFMVGHVLHKGFQSGLKTNPGSNPRSWLKHLLYTWQGRISTAQGGDAKSRCLFFLWIQVEMLFWPIAQGINFYFLPISLRLVYVNATCLVWSVVLSTFKHNV